MKTDTLIAFSIPAFLIPNMPQEGDLAYAEVLNHTKTYIELGIGAIGIRVDVKNPAALYAKGAKLYFNADGTVVKGTVEKGELTIPNKEDMPVQTQAPRGGSSRRADAKLP